MKKRRRMPQAVFVELPLALHTQLAESARRNCRTIQGEARMALQSYLGQAGAGHDARRAPRPTGGEDLAALLAEFLTAGRSFFRNG